MLDEFLRSIGVMALLFIAVWTAPGIFAFLRAPFVNKRPDYGEYWGG